MPDSVVRHDYSLRLRPRKIFYQERNRYLMLVKSLRWSTLLLMAPVHVLAEVMTWGFVLRRRLPLREKIDAYMWMARHWTRVRAARARAQATRRASDRALLRSTVGTLEFSQVASGARGRVLHIVFDPMFSLWRGVLLLLVRW